MAQIVNRRVPEPLDPAITGIKSVEPRDIDVTGQLASRAGELYAAEERRQRKERTDRLIERAALSPEE